NNSLKAYEILTIVKMLLFSLKPQLTICNFGGSLRAERRDFGDKLPGETFFNVWVCKQKGDFA
ncbi:hypothetical protein LJC54_04315, partial [Parabacteroides sp. OttesenSCG-928-J18]|nr:hypothetical protein [Parabacteroides sp. OttesenSCG-928-J18]